MTVRIINKSKHPLPAYATELSAGMDIRANLSEPIALEPLQRCLVLQVCTFLCRRGFEAQISSPQRFGYQERYLGIELSGYYRCRLSR